MPLPEPLRALFQAHDGTLPFGQYMAWCNAQYYAHAQPFGGEGDFITAPDISPLFGEMLGAWLLHVREQMGGQPSAVALVELGAGRGALMADILRVARLRPAFRAGLSVHLVETSPALRTIQRQVLEGEGVPLVWHDTVDTLPDNCPLLVVANEFFDALPVEQYVLVEGQWHQQMVVMGQEGGLSFGVSGDTVREECPAALAVMEGLCARLQRQGGALLTADYGYTCHPAFGDTVQAVSKHQYCDVLASPGQVDITAHVDFSALMAVATRHGLWSGVTTQGAFLHTCGIRQRLDRLLAGKDAAAQAVLVSGYQRLTAAGQMGELFKVLAVSPAALPGF